MAQCRLKTTNHLRFFFVVPPRGWRTDPFMTETTALLFSSLSTLASFVHLGFSLPLYPWPSGPRRATAQNDVTSSLSLSALLHCSEVENFRRYIFFGRLCISWLLFHWHPTNAIYVAFPLSFKNLNTQVHPVFEIHEITRPVKVQIFTNGL